MLVVKENSRRDKRVGGSQSRVWLILCFGLGWLVGFGWLVELDVGMEIS